MWTRKPHCDTDTRNFSFTKEEVTQMVALAGIQDPAQFRDHEIKALIHKCAAAVERMRNHQSTSFEVRWS